MMVMTVVVMMTMVVVSEPGRFLLNEEETQALFTQITTTIK